MRLVDQRRRVRRHGILALLGMAAALLTSCSSGSGQSTPRVSGRVTQVVHGAAQCLRDHGISNFADPVLDADGRLQLDTGLLRSFPVAVQLSAESACKAQITAAEQLVANQRPAASPQELAQATKFSQCMRKHAWPNFPDPDSNGAYDTPYGSPPGAMPTSKNDPSFKACNEQVGTHNP